VPAAVAGRIAALATLMRGLIEADEVTVYTPVPVDAARIPDVPGLPRVNLAVGVPAPASVGLAWGATNAVALAPPPLEAITTTLPEPMRRALVEPVVAVDVARAANDRRLAISMDPWAKAIGRDDAAAIDAIVERAAEASPTGEWIAKAPLTSAGRDRIRGAIPIADDVRTRLTRLLAGHGALVVEPWLDRRIDFGVTLAIAADGAVTALDPHGLVVDPHGGFRGIDLEPRGLSPVWRAALATMASRHSPKLAMLGYRGVATVDGFVHLDRDGQERLRPIVEINARLSFGIIARALCARLGRTALRVGTDAPPPDALVLVAPTASDPSSAWLL
jgi:hypothetical protein